MRSVQVRLKRVGAVAGLSVLALGLTGCGGSDGASPSTSTSAPIPSGPSTTPPPELETPESVKEALGEACVGAGGDFNQFGTQAGGAAHIACSVEQNGHTNSIVYSWDGDDVPAELHSTLAGDIKYDEDNGRKVCLVESKQHKWAVHILDVDVVGKPAGLWSEVASGHAKTTGASC